MPAKNLGLLNWNIICLDPHFRGEKSSKCIQCDDASSKAGNLKTHLKTHSGEETDECNQCDYASPHVSNARAHMKTHTGKVKQIKPV